MHAERETNETRLKPQKKDKWGMAEAAEEREEKNREAGKGRGNRDGKGDRYTE